MSYLLKIIPYIIEEIIDIFIIIIVEKITNAYDENFKP